ncbi:DUF6054 family protein [Actinomyces ruminis]|uniref:Uncharacterized protein n=1 Tax=Actinomyces ruminis TaxID=1937003 RepID=A0ABX4MC22_9ACTO|nr:DUF6054 family protein [Actinomyces ruminis]PHP53022.1 hypothetical protein BW737_005880 [Actinomyces ruminis]
MSVYTRTLVGPFDELMPFLTSSITGQSVSASEEPSADVRTAAGRVAVRAFERFSWTGSNRVGMTVTAVEDGGAVHVVGITVGGSQAVFMKINTFGEEAFLETLVNACAAWESKRGALPQR